MYISRANLSIHQYLAHGHVCRKRGNALKYAYITAMYKRDLMLYKGTSNIHVMKKGCELMHEI